MDTLITGYQPGLLKANNQTLECSNSLITGNNNVITGRGNSIYGNNNVVRGDHCYIVGRNNAIKGRWYRIVGDDNRGEGPFRSLNGRRNTLELGKLSAIEEYRSFGMSGSRKRHRSDKSSAATGVSAKDTRSKATRAIPPAASAAQSKSEQATREKLEQQHANRAQRAIVMADMAIKQAIGKMNKSGTVSPTNASGSASVKPLSTSKVNAILTSVLGASEAATDASSPENKRIAEAIVNRSSSSRVTENDSDKDTEHDRDQAQTVTFKRLSDAMFARIRMCEERAGVSANPKSKDKKDIPYNESDKIAPAMCLICMCNRANTAFFPCGHMAVCQSCSAAYDSNTCIQCRAKSTTRSYVYM